LQAADRSEKSKSLLAMLFSLIQCFFDGMHQYVIPALLTLQANFVKVIIKHAISMLILDVRAGTFLFPKKQWSDPCVVRCVCCYY